MLMYPYVLGTYEDTYGSSVRAHMMIVVIVLQFQVHVEARTMVMVLGLELEVRLDAHTSCLEQMISLGTVFGSYGSFDAQI